MDTLNDFVDKVYCINLDRRSDRIELIDKEFNINDIEYERFSAIDGLKIPKDQFKKEHQNDRSKMGVLGAIRSHRAVLKDAIDNNYNKICIFEDDLIFCKDFKLRFNYYVKNVPTDWDVMYLGCHYWGCRAPKYVKKYIFKNYRNFGAFAYILNKSMIDFLYLYTSKELKPIDDYMADIPSMGLTRDVFFNVYSFIPFFVKTTKTISDISDRDDPYEYDVVNDYYTDYAYEYNY